MIHYNTPLKIRKILKKYDFYPRLSNLLAGSLMNIIIFSIIYLISYEINIILLYTWK